MLSQRRRRWTNIDSTLVECLGVMVTPVTPDLEDGGGGGLMPLGIHPPKKKKGFSPVHSGSLNISPIFRTSSSSQEVFLAQPLCPQKWRQAPFIYSFI